MKSAPIPQDTREALSSQLDSAPKERVAAALGVHHSTLSRAIAGDPVTAAIAGKLAAVHAKTRTAGEIQAAVSRVFQAPRRYEAVTSWSVEQIRRARDDQMVGVFQLPVRMAEASQTDDAIFCAREARIAPQDAVASRIVPAPGGIRIANRAQESITMARATMRGIHGTLVDHSVAVAYLQWASNKSGTRLAAELKQWPLEFVRWDAYRQTLVTPIDGGSSWVDITHGDGTWIVFRKSDFLPWRQGACVLPAALVWAAHAEGLGDWSASTRAHGLSKILGEPPPGTALQKPDGSLTPEGTAFLQLLVDLASGATSAGIKPPGSTIEFLTDNSTAWQIFRDLILNREKAAARIYLGTDATLGATGGAPGVDIAELFGVATTKLQGDFTAIQSGLKSGVFDPWTALNEGDSSRAPSLEYLLPDPDADDKREEQTKNYERLDRTLATYRNQGFVVDQTVVDTVAQSLGISPAPKLAALVRPPATVLPAPATGV